MPIDISHMAPTRVTRARRRDPVPALRHHVDRGEAAIELRQRRERTGDRAGSQVVVTEERGVGVVVDAIDDHAADVDAEHRGRRQVVSSIGVEASGWETALKFIAVGLGLGVVNDVCRIPRGLTARPLPDLAPVRYYLLSRPRGVRGELVEELERQLLQAV